jgi:hypothetical protein
MAASLHGVALLPLGAGISAFFLAKPPVAQPAAVTSPVLGND